ncbi:MAG: phosphate signaling complex protein PhoU [Proteobacteria bacterium]|nr:phosphate signaling complex protein PhoU [Pseudomonadota bacterium]
MTQQHIVKSYDEELNRLTTLITQMGGLGEAQVASAIQAVTKRDSELASRVVETDRKVDAMEREVQALVIRLLALRQPMAQDLRTIVTALKVSADLERIADYAKNVAKRALVLNQMRPIRTVNGVQRLSRIVQEMIKDILDAYVDLDAAKAVEVWRRDEEVDDMYTSLFRELLTYMMEDPRNITACTHLLFIAKNIERIGDHVTNIAETIHFLVRGEALPVERPKGETTIYAVVEPEKPAEGPGGESSDK